MTGERSPGPRQLTVGGTETQRRRARDGETEWPGTDRTRRWPLDVAGRRRRSAPGRCNFRRPCAALRRYSARLQTRAPATRRLRFPARPDLPICAPTANSRQCFRSILPTVTDWTAGRQFVHLPNPDATTTIRIPLRFDCDSTALRSFDNLRYDLSAQRLLHCGRNK